MEKQSFHYVKKTHGQDLKFYFIANGLSIHT